MSENDLKGDADQAWIAIMMRQVPGLAMDQARAEELAAELRRLNRAVLDHVGNLSFEREPSHFAVLLEDHAR